MTHTRSISPIHLRSPLPALGLGVLCLLAACGGDTERESSGDPGFAPQTQGSSDAPEIDPCTLVTGDEAGSVLGASVAEGQRPSEANIPPRLVTCRYVAQRGEGMAVLTVMVRSSTNADEATTGFGMARDQYEGAQPVDGVGDEAFWLGNQLNVLEGPEYLIIGGDVELAQAKVLARQALQRLP